MNKKVCIKIKGLHNLDSMEEDQIEVIYIGSYYKRNGKHYIKYEEPGDDEGYISHNMLKISDNEVELTANGRTGHHMVFTAGQKNMTYYMTPFGGINMGIDTSSIEVSATCFVSTSTSSLIAPSLIAYAKTSTYPP